MMTEISKPRFTTWGELLESLSSLGDSEMVSFGDGPTSIHDRCLVSDTWDLDDADDMPIEAIEQGWRTSLLKEHVEGVIGNLRRQVGEPTPDLILRGIEYFVDNDAFITVGPADD